MLLQFSNGLLLGQFLLFSIILRVRDRIKAKSIEDGATILSVTKVHGPHVFIIQVFDGKVGEQSAISELMTSEVNFLPELTVMHVVLPPLGLPLLRLEGHWEGASHLDCLADGEIGSGFMVEETQDLVVEVD